MSADAAWIRSVSTWNCVDMVPLLTSWPPSAAVSSQARTGGVAGRAVVHRPSAGTSVEG